LELPVFVIVTLCVAEDVPVVTLPKLRLAGLTFSVRVAAIPVPLRLTEVGEAGALLTIEMLPDAAPTNVGRKAAVIVVCCPAFKFNGKVKPLMLKLAPDSVIWLTFSVAVPMFLMIKAWDNVLPATTFPKLIDVELTWMAGTGAAVTVSVAGALVTVPAVFVTTTWNVDPLSAVVVAAVV
jgi:hypothetical protein